MSRYAPQPDPIERDLSGVKAAFIEWLVDPNRGTQADFAREHDVAPKTLSRWKREPDFREVWDRRCAELNVDPGRVQEVLDALHRKAAEGDSRAANLYLQYIDRFTPRKIVIEDKSVKDMTDEELAAQLEEAALAARSRLKVVGE